MVKLRLVIVVEIALYVYSYIILLWPDQVFRKIAGKELFLLDAHFNLRTCVHVLILVLGFAFSFLDCLKDRQKLSGTALKQILVSFISYGGLWTLAFVVLASFELLQLFVAVIT